MIIGRTAAQIARRPTFGLRLHMHLHLHLHCLSLYVAFVSRLRCICVAFVGVAFAFALSFPLRCLCVAFALHLCCLCLRCICICIVFPFALPLCRICVVFALHLHLHYLSLCAVFALPLHCRFTLHVAALFGINAMCFKPHKARSQATVFLFCLGDASCVLGCAVGFKHCVHCVDADVEMEMQCRRMVHCMASKPCRHTLRRSFETKAVSWIVDSSYAVGWCRDIYVLRSMHFAFSSRVVTVMK